MYTSYPILTTRKCFECGSSLFLVDKRTEEVEGQFAPVITSIYKCSNQTCQDDFDKKTAQRIKFQKDQEEAKQIRIKNMRLKRTKIATA